jgi:ATP-dependent Zn protease
LQVTAKARITIACAVLLVIAVLFETMRSSASSIPSVTYSQFVKQVQAGQVASAVVLEGDSGVTRLTCGLKDGRAMQTVLPSDYRHALSAMQQHAVDVEIRASTSNPLRSALPFMLLLGAWFFLIARTLRFGRNLRR